MEITRIFTQSVSFFALLFFTSAAGQERVEIELPDGSAMRFVWVEPGQFIMGAEGPLDAGAHIVGTRLPNTQPFEVTISRGFYLGENEVTQGQWQSLMDSKPWTERLSVLAEFVRDIPTHPVVGISWWDAQEFIEKLNDQQQDFIFRLPTEAEWEYACKAGTSTKWYFGDDFSLIDNYEWTPSNTWDVGSPHARPVGQLLPNPWGLYDMSGNVWEFVQDGYGSYPTEPTVDPVNHSEDFSLKVARGGSFGVAFGSTLAAACGVRVPAGALDYDIGFRLVMQKRDSPPSGVDQESWGRLKSTNQ